MFANLITLLFHSRTYAHKAHLATTSFASHAALDEFYKSLTNKTDALVEMYQGRHGVIEIADYAGEQDDVTQPSTVLAYHLKIIEATRDQAVGDDRPPQNVVDEICGLYLTVLYKIRTFN